MTTVFSQRIESGTVRSDAGEQAGVREVLVRIPQVEHRPGLSRARIVEASVALFDAEGPVRPDPCGSSRGRGRLCEAPLRECMQRTVQEAPDQVRRRDRPNDRSTAIQMVPQHPDEGVRVPGSVVQNLLDENGRR